MAYANGRLPADVLATVSGTGQQIFAPLVPQTDAMRRDFKARFGKDLRVTDGYRDFDAQVRVKKAKGFLAATPGKSNHGLALAIDFGSGVERFGTPEYLWMKQNAPKYGWTHPSWAEPTGYKPEPWHWEGTYVSPSRYTGSNDTVNNPAGEDEDDLPYEPSQLQNISQAAVEAVIKSDTFKSVVQEAVRAEVGADSARRLDQTVNYGERTIASLTRVEKGLDVVKDVALRIANENWLNRVIESLTRVEKRQKGETA